MKSFDDQTAIELGKLIGQFFDAITKDGLQTYINRSIVLKNAYKKDQSIFSLYDVASIYKIEKEVIIHYLEALHKHKDYLSDPNNCINITKGFYLYAEDQADRKTRWLFRTAANIFNAKECGFWQHAARIVDTAVYTAFTVTAPLEGVLSGVAAVDSYVETVDYVIKCCPDC